MAVRGRCRWWSVTINVDGEGDDDWLHGDATLKATYDAEGSGIAYAVFNHELAPSSGQRHLQGAVRMAKKTTFNRMKELFPTAHLEQCRCDNIVPVEEMFQNQYTLIACDGIDKAFWLNYCKSE